MKSSVLFLAIISVSISIVSVTGADVDSHRELKCLKNPPKAVQPDEAWASKVGSWYITDASSLHAHRTAAELADIELEDLAHHELYYESCLRFDWSKDTIVSGFGDKRIDCQLRPHKEADGSFSFRYPNLGLNGRAWPLVTDNKSYIMFYVCWPDLDESSWAVISPNPVVSAKAKKEVHKKARELGFSHKQFTSIRFETCGEGDNDDDNDNNDGKDEL